MMLVLSYTKILHFFKKSGVTYDMIVKVYLSLLNKSKIKYYAINK